MTEPKQITQEETERIKKRLRIKGDVDFNCADGRELFLRELVAWDGSDDYFEWRANKQGYQLSGMMITAGESLTLLDFTNCSLIPLFLEYLEVRDDGS